MEFFRTTPTIDWMGKKWLLIGISVVLSGIGVAGLIARGGPNYGIDFKGGTVVQVKFREAPPLDRIRTALSRQGLGGSTLQRYGAEANNEIMVGLDLEATSEADLGAGRRAIVQALGQEFGGADKPNFQEVGPQSVGEQLRGFAAGAGRDRGGAAGFGAGLFASPLCGAER
jgi:preprotein translocase subunit SecF